MREPGASDVFTCGLTFSPASTAFLASRPAASSTLGLEVLVHEVMAAISTSPLPMLAALGAWAAVAPTCADSGVGLLSAISTTCLGAPGFGSTGGFSAVSPSYDSG